MRKLLLAITIVFFGFYILACALLYTFQERLIFIPQKLEKNFQFTFAQSFEELNIKSSDGKNINGLLFKSEHPQGLVFYLHGNAGSLASWSQVAQVYTDLNYDVFIFDYRSYGKSEGEISSQGQLFQDNQVVYEELKKHYKEDAIIILGYSIGTGLASKLASTNNPRLLMLQAPYYSLTDVMKQRFPFVPTFILKYKFATNEYLQKCNMPVVIFHGNQDEVIPYSSSLKLQAEFKPQDTLIILNEQGHNGMTFNPDYYAELRKILSK